MLFNGFMVQCVNELPKLRDKSESLYRRLLVIPFEKRFEGRERKYIKDDYLKRKDVLEYVLYKLLATTDYYELDVPQTCIDMLEEFKLENDPVRQFAEEVFAEATWDLLPYKFMYDCYRHWFQRNVPSGRPVGRNAFLKSLKGLAAECGWLVQDKVRSDGRMDRPEPLILEYDVREWMNSGYTGSDPGRKCMPDLAESYRGFVRVSTAGSEMAKKQIQRTRRIRDMTNLTKEEYARLHLKASAGCSQRRRGLHWKRMRLRRSPLLRRPFRRTRKRFSAVRIAAMRLSQRRL